MTPSEAQSIEIVDFRPAFLRAFQDLNRQWIEAHFEIKEEDHKALDNPVEGIIERGGHIFIALLNGEAVGTSALIRMNDQHYDYELAKMAVASAAQERGIGLSMQHETKSLRPAPARSELLRQPRLCISHLTVGQRVNV